MKNITASLTIAFLLIANQLFSQTMFQKTYGGAAIEYGYAAIQTSDGGYAIAGHTQAFGAGDYDFYLIRTNSTGDTLWTRTYGGSGEDRCLSLQQTNDGGFIMAGYTISFGSGTDGLLVKTDANGTIQWAENFGGLDSDGGGFVSQTGDGGYIVTGYSVDVSTSNQDASLVRFDGAGNLIWAKTYGGISYEAGYCVQQISGGYIMVGHTASYSPGGYNIFLLRTDTAGTIMWAKSMGGSATDMGNWVEQTADGGFIVTGYTLSFGAGGSDVCLVKTDGSGNIQWARTYGTLNSDGAFCVHTVAGGYVSSGYLTVSFGGNEDALLMRTDSAGIILWHKGYGGTSTERAYAVQPAADGGYILGGFTGSFGSSPYDLYMIKTDSTGNSGCNETLETLYSISAPFSVTSPSPTVGTGMASGNPNVVTEYGTLISTPCIATDAQNISAEEDGFFLFPNPATEELRIKNAEFRIGKIEISNLLGEKVFEKHLTSDDRRPAISVADLPHGIYFVNLTNEKNRVVVKKFVKM